MYSSVYAELDERFPFKEEIGIENYLTRYYSEGTYESWYHNNFNSTIEVTLGLTDSVSYIEDRIDKCKAEAREKSNQWVRANYLNWNADIYGMQLLDKWYFTCETKTGIRDINNAGVILAELGFHKAAITQYDIALSIYQQYETAQINKETSLEQLHNTAIQSEKHSKTSVTKSNFIQNIWSWFT